MSRVHENPPADTARLPTRTRIERDTEMAEAVADWVADATRAISASAATQRRVSGCFRRRPEAAPAGVMLPKI